MDARFQKALAVFEENARAVDRLLDFGNEIIKVAVDTLRQLEPPLRERLKRSELQPFDNRIGLLSGIHAGSLEPQYQAMFNQCVVLLVSYFDSAAHTLFRCALESALGCSAPVKAAEQELRLSWRAVTESEGSPASMFADLLISQNNISFQDMGSIARAFQKHLGIEIPKDTVTNDIILGQASRHALVHAAAMVDKRMADQVRDAYPRQLKPELFVGRPIKFAPDEVRALATSMTIYLRRVVTVVTDMSAQWSDTRALGESDIRVSPSP